MREHIQTVAIAALSLTLAFTPARTQTSQAVKVVPGFTVSIRPSVLVSNSDSVAIAYVVTLASTSHDSLSEIFVDAPTLRHVVRPGVRPEWDVASAVRRRPVAVWMKLTNLVMPGDSTPPLIYTATGLLDVVQYWVERDPQGDSVITEAPDDTSLTSDTTVTVEGSTGLTVGVTPFPTDMSSAALSARLSGLVDRVCALGWIDNRGTCNSLQANTRPQAGALNALLHDLDAQRGKHVSESAYVLLYQNASFLIRRL